MFHNVWGVVFNLQSLLANVNKQAITILSTTALPVFVMTSGYKIVKQDVLLQSRGHAQAEGQAWNAFLLRSCHFIIYKPYALPDDPAPRQAAANLETTAGIQPGPQASHRIGAYGL